MSCGRVPDKRKYFPPNGTVSTAVLGLVNIGFVKLKFFFSDWKNQFLFYVSFSFALLCLFRYYISLNIF